MIGGLPHGQLRLLLVVLALTGALGSIADAGGFMRLSFYEPQPIDAPPAEPPQVMSVAAADDPPVINGMLDDACWQEAEAFSPFVVYRLDRQAEEAREMRMTFDRDHVYIAARLEKEPGYELKVDTRADQDTHMWRDDAMEIFLDPGLSYDEYYQFIINAGGYYCDLRHVRRWERDPAAASPDVLRLVRDTDAKWESGIEFAVGGGAVEDDHWTIEMRIPVASMGLPGIPVGSRWGVNFASNNPRTNQLTNWVPGDWHNPHTYGQVVFGQPRLRVEQTSFGNLQRGTNLFQTTLTNLQDTTRHYDLAVEVIDEHDEYEPITHRAHFSLRSGEQRTVACSYVIPFEAEEAQISVRIEDDESALLFQSQRRPQFNELLHVDFEPYGYLAGDQRIGGRLRVQVGDVDLTHYQLDLRLVQDQRTLARQRTRLERTHAQFFMDPGPLEPGRYQLKAELLDPTGRVIARRTSPFALANSPFPID